MRRLADACGVSRRTIYRDLATLEAAGIQILYRPDHQGYELARECLLQPLQLDEHEALALLILSRSSRAEEPLGLARHVQSALAKVVQALPQPLRDEDDSLCRAAPGRGRPARRSSSGGACHR